MSTQGIDHVGWYVADVEESAAALCHDFGFARADAHYHGPGATDGGRSVLLRHGQVALLLTAAVTPDHPAAEFVRKHGDGVATIAFRTDDLGAAFGAAVAAGAAPVSGPAFRDYDGRRVGTAVVSGFGDVRHLLIERDGAAPPPPPPPQEDGGLDGGPDGGLDGGPDGGLLTCLDHVAVCLHAGQLDATVRFYRDAFGLEQIFDERIEVSGQAMLSKVVQDNGRRVTFTLIEPDPALAPGQIDDFLAAHGGPGVQHLAFGTDDIARAVRTLAGRGVEFLGAPPGYYRTLEARLGELAIPVGVLEQLNVLADRDRWGELFQIFTRSSHERRTFFMELIERHGALTFGSRNIRALYEALGGEHASMRMPT
jgi:4-hydroxymandelate synthase